MAIYRKPLEESLNTLDGPSGLLNIFSRCFVDDTKLTYRYTVSKTFGFYFFIFFSQLGIPFYYFLHK